MIFKELKGGKKQLTSQCFCKEMETPKILKILFFFDGGAAIIRGFSLFLRSLVT